MWAVVVGRGAPWVLRTPKTLRVAPAYSFHVTSLSLWNAPLEGLTIHFACSPPAQDKLGKSIVTAKCRTVVVRLGAQIDAENSQGYVFIAFLPAKTTRREESYGLRLSNARFPGTNHGRPPSTRVFAAHTSSVVNY